MTKGYEMADKRNVRITPEIVERRKKQWEQSIVKKYGTSLKRAKLLYRIDQVLGKAN
ncbi:hypothetical protein ACG6P0_000427 [Enterococcus hirae]|nr:MULTISPECIES: hypothetical protein [Enterococcus]EMF0054083.1 hypothetical protein [Enterococcus hirae]EMF0057836.1 hypothetical protein [Enterococcus hirae]EMF0072928.1 hypothetical protein [Enterococcus hirae]EMF0111080.1 hypothetical protein [Enterococcus hirae]EMF0133471.1 hypothetical protein [Enterococcus hirae]